MAYGRPPPRIAGMVSLKVDNLSYRTTPEDLRRLFDKYGEIGDIYIPRNPYTRESRGFAFVRYFDKRDADDAMDGLDGRMFDGRELRVQQARYGRPPEKGFGGRKYDRSRSRSKSRRRRSYSRSRSRSRGRSRSRSRRSSRSSSRGRCSRSRSSSRSHSRERSRDEFAGAGKRLLNRSRDRSKEGSKRYSPAKVYTDGSSSRAIDSSKKENSEYRVIESCGEEVEDRNGSKSPRDSSSDDCSRRVSGD